MRIILIVTHDAFRQARGASGFFGGPVNRATAEPFSRTDSTVRRLRSKRRDSGGWVLPPAAPSTLADSARAACRHDVAAV